MWRWIWMSRCAPCASAPAPSKMSISSRSDRGRRTVIAPSELGGAESQGRYGEIFDRGYKHYDGPRLGRRQAFNALIRYSIQRAMGIKKKWTAKIIPIIIYVVAAGTVLILIG